MATVDYVIKLVDGFSATSNTFQKQIKEMDSAYNKLNSKRVASPFDTHNKSINQLKANLDRYKKSYDSSFRTDHMLKYKRLIELTEGKIKSLTKSTQTCGEKSKGAFSKMGEAMGISRTMVGWGAAIAVSGAAISSVVSFGQEAVMAAAQVEKYSVTLKTMLGSKGAARDRMTEYADIAKSTPFELNQVVEAGNQLQSIGRYSRENLVQLGDLAAASGKPIEQVMGAYAKLSTGQKGEGVNMFRDLLISTDDWIKATGKGIAKNGELLASTEEMLTALPKIMASKGFSGMMEAQADTTEGKISNLKDAYFGLKVAVGDRMKPAVDSFISGATKTVDIMTKWAEVPLAVKIAEEKSGLESLVKSITAVNTDTETRKRLMDELQTKYPEFLDGLNKETVANDQLLDRLTKVNDEYDRKINLAVAGDMFKEEESTLKDLKTKKAFAKTVGYFDEQISKFENRYGFKSDESMYNREGIRTGKFAQEKAEDRYKGIMRKKPVARTKEETEYLTEYTKAEGARRGRDTYRKKAGNTIDIDSKIQDSQTNLNVLQKNYDEATNESILASARAMSENAKLTKYGKGSKEILRLNQLIKQSKFEDKDYAELKTLMNFQKKRTTYTPGGSSGSKVEKAADAITGGGKNIKQIYINIDSLIKSNTNQFTPGQNPKDATTFMDQLTNALQMMVNDTNYAG